MQYKTECAKEQLQELSNDISSALDKHKDVQNQLLQLQKELRSIETKKNVQKLISKASEKFYGLIGKTVNDREKDALKAKVKALEGESEQLSDRLGKAILEKEQKNHSTTINNNICGFFDIWYCAYYLCSIPQSRGC